MGRFPSFRCHVLLACSLACSLVGCDRDSSDEECSGANCPGCCDELGRCRLGDIADACGLGGETCQVCLGGTCSQGECHERECQPRCDGLSCGPDGCGGSCGECLDCDGRADPSLCMDGQCESLCCPDCGDRECGFDGCDGVCGVCSDGLACIEDLGVCQEGGIPVANSCLGNVFQCAGSFDEADEAVCEALPTHTQITAATGAVYRYGADEGLEVYGSRCSDAACFVVRGSLDSMEIWTSDNQQPYQVYRADGGYSLVCPDGYEEVVIDLLSYLPPFESSVGTPTCRATLVPLSCDSSEQSCSPDGECRSIVSSDVEQSFCVLDFCAPCDGGRACGDEQICVGEQEAYCVIADLAQL